VCATDDDASPWWLSGGRPAQPKFLPRHSCKGCIRTFKAYLARLRKIDWVVYAKRPFGGSRAVLAYLSRYTHRVAISNRRLVAADDGGVSFRWKDYRIEGPGRWKTMTLTPHQFIRRFLTYANFNWMQIRACRRVPSQLGWPSRGRRRRRRHQGASMI